MSNIREVFWDCAVHRDFDNFRPKEVTNDKLSRIKNIMFDDKDFWDIIIMGHGNFTRITDMPTEIRNKCLYAFFNLIKQKMIDNGILPKPEPIIKCKPKRKYTRKIKTKTPDETVTTPHE